MVRTITITGTRSISAEDDDRLDVLFDDYLLPFGNAHFYIGGAAGIDTATLDWLAENTSATLTVVVPCTVIDQPQSASSAIASWQGHNRLAEVIELAAPDLDTSAYHARNRYMVDRSDFVIGFPRGTDQTSGTWYTLNYAADRGKPRLVVPV
ncbi:DNA-processing protein DprA [Saccharothrix sp. ALI-22-I]|uniref:DNA-processing protein DprA n=1 Tax=Saccharothrix sp. ALI-22-I TaxID=1933778 RepID=UPI001930FF6F|nr:DNA-processing protein DprA [Saccharothrix sp. ALI-22-I]